MPYSKKQHALFEAVAHDPKIAKERGISTSKAAVLASEGVKDSAPKKIRVRFRKSEVISDSKFNEADHPRADNGKSKSLYIKNGYGNQKIKVRFKK